MADSSKSKVASSAHTTKSLPKVTIMQDYNEDSEGNIWYRWKTPSETDWHYKLTPFTEKPYILFEHMSQEEFTDLVTKKKK